MATTVSSTTFAATYKDDYRDSDHFHRILFNNGKALQARELTQLQTIIQKEVARLAKFVVNEGAIFNNSGSLASGTNAAAYTYLKVTALPSGYAGLKGTEINHNNIIFATVKAIIPDNTTTETPPGTLIVRLGKSGGAATSISADTSQPNNFALGTVITTTLGTATILSASGSVGKSSLIETPAFDTFAGGHLITTEAQTLVLDATSLSFTGIVGFKLNQQIITSSDNVALFDNSGSTPNLSSPGADRLKLTLALTKKSDITVDDIFYEVFSIRNGNVSLVKESDSILGTINRVVADRTKSITGDFVERKPGGMFNLTVNEDSASTNFLSMKVSSGCAFIQGNRIDRDYDFPFRVQKSNDPNIAANLTTVNTEQIAAKYGNYFLSSENNTFGLISRFADSYGHVNLFDAVQNRDTSGMDGNVIGTARVRNLDKFGDDFRTHVFDVQMNAGKNVSQIRSFGIDSDNNADLKAVSGDFGVLDKDQNSLLFPLKRSRAFAADNLVMTVQKVITGTKSGNTTAVTSTTNATFADTEEWIYSVDSSGQLISPISLSAGGSGSTSATITGTPNGAFHLLAYETFPANKVQRLEKTLTPSDGSLSIDSNLSLSNNVFTLTKTDIFEFNKVIDDTTSEDITYKFKFDNGQRDNYYAAGTGTLRSGVTAPAGTINVHYKHFTHDTVPTNQIGYFDAQSYVGITYDQIPYYTTSAGKQFRLSDVIDIRPMKNPSTGKFSGGISRFQRLPRNDDTISVGVAKYFNPRLDVISLSPSGVLHYNKGLPNSDPEYPTGIPPENMTLHEILFNPFTLNKNDVKVTTSNNRGYKMSDIRSIDRRTTSLEEFTTLTAAEAGLAELQVLDPTTNSIRSTQGLSGDGFFNAIQSQINNEDYRASGKADIGILTAKTFTRGVGLTYDSAASGNTTVRKGKTVWPVFTEVEASFSQPIATRIENVNQFEQARHVASALLIPDHDHFTTRRQVDENYVSESNESLVSNNTPTVQSQ